MPPVTAAMTSISVLTHLPAGLSGVLAAIPAPPSNSIGPFRLYGLMIALGVLVSVMIAQRRWSRWGGEDDAIVAIAVWAVPAGLIGARLYHVLTDWGTLYDEGRWTNAFKIWNGGLGIPGGVLAGTLVGIIVARRTVPSWRRMGDAVAPAIPVAQAIGRLGNYFNQEVYGRATDLPWGLRVDDEILLAQNPNEQLGATFHPTFLYEGLWNLALAGLIIWGGTKVVLRPGRWFAVYIAGYGLGRLWVESLRIDEATLIAGVRVNIWMSLVIIAGGLLWLFWGGSPIDREATDAFRGGTPLSELFAHETSFAASEQFAGSVEPEGEDSGGEDSGGEDSVVAERSEGDAGSSADAIGEAGPEPD